MSIVKISAEDRLLVYELLARYALAVDMGDADSYAGTFAEDGTLGINFTNNAEKGITQDRWTGRNVIRDYIAGAWIDSGLLYRQIHFNTNMIIAEAGPDWCKVRSYSLIAENTGEEEQTLRYLGLYRDYCVKQDDQWYFKERLYTEWVPADKKQFWL